MKRYCLAPNARKVLLSTAIDTIKGIFVFLLLASGVPIMASMIVVITMLLGAPVLEKDLLFIRRNSYLGDTISSKCCTWSLLVHSKSRGM